jgi:hypothetical protein
VDSSSTRARALQPRENEPRLAGRAGARLQPSPLDRSPPRDDDDDARAIAI